MSQYAAFYSGCNYTGTVTWLPVGQFSGAAQMGIAEKTIRSVQVPPPSTVILYTGLGFTGTSIYLTENTPCLTAPMAAATSSILIMSSVRTPSPSPSPSPAPPSVTLFTGCEWRTLLAAALCSPWGIDRALHTWQRVFHTK